MMASQGAHHAPTCVRWSDLRQDQRHNDAIPPKTLNPVRLAARTGTLFRVGTVHCVKIRSCPVFPEMEHDKLEPLTPCTAMTRRIELTLLSIEHYV